MSLKVKQSYTDPEKDEKWVKVQPRPSRPREKLCRLTLSYPVDLGAGVVLQAV